MSKHGTESNFLTRQMTRRQLNKTLAAAGVTMVTMPLASGLGPAAAQEETPMYFGWAGYDDLNLWPGIEEKFGAPPRFTFWGDEEEGIVKMKAGFKPDLLFPCNYKIKAWYDNGLVQPIDVSRLKNWPDVLDSLKDIDGTVVDGQRIWVPVDWGQTSVTYRTDLAPEYVDNETWGILWDPKYKGRMAMFDSIVDGVSVAAIMAGVDPFDFTEETIEITRAKMKELVPLLRYFSNDSTTLEQGLASGELVAATTWNESITRLKAQGLPVKFMNPKEGAMTWVCGLSIAVGTEKYDQALEMIDAMLDPSSRVYEMTEFGYGGSTKAGFEQMDEALLLELGLSKNPDEILSAGIYQLPITNEAKVQEMFDEVKAGL